MRIDDLNEAPMGVLNRMAQKVVSKVPGSIGAKAQGKLDTGKVANQWKKDYMTYLGRTGQKPDTENLKAYLKTLGLSDQDSIDIVGESALIERALTGGEIDKIMLKAAQKGAAGGTSASSSATSVNEPAAGDAAATSGQAEPAASQAANEPAAGDAAATSGQAEPAASQAAPAKPSLAQRAGQAIKGLAGKAASAVGQKLAPAAGASAQKVEPTVGGAAKPKMNIGRAATQQPPGVTAPATSKGAGAGIDTYINNWAKNINAAASPQEKINLAKEVINFLKDRKGSPEGKRGAAMAKSVLKRSNDPTLQKMAQSGAFALERKMYAVANKLLEAIGLTWRDLGYRISVTESTSDYVVIIER